MRKEEREREDFEIQKVEKKERIDKNDLQLDWWHNLVKAKMVFSIG